MLRDNWWIIVACVAAAVLAAAIYEASKTTAYRAQAKVLLLQDDPNATLSGNGVFLDPVRQRATALELITGPNVATRVQRQLQQQASQLELLASTRLPDASVIQRANGFAAEVQKRWQRNLVLAALAGLFVGLLLAFLRDRLDDRLRSEEDLAAVLPGVPVVATIPAWRPGQRWRRVAAESFYNLGVAMRSLNGSGASSWLVTSALGEDGKTTTAL